MKFVYSVWFENPTLSPDDQDRRWPACFIVDAGDSASALGWGDHLARSYAVRSGQLLLRSNAEPKDASALPGLDALPVVQQGIEATDEEIGW